MAPETSQKYDKIVGESMKDKPVTDLAGIGDVLGGHLTKAGFDKAYTVLGQYLVLKKNAELFKKWMKDTCNVNAKQAGDCYNCLNGWCEEFL
ncbi:barrier-to-autointegration factor-like [Glossina fuscipes]|uniref:Barrier-to-autointegration factor-like protein n=1 Tax=Glossina fuscipes TaxID=7396 RepID=A0A9C5ZH63_9MUSC|nr:barrier-to-autointegration factor-like [Glossina fuscipes]KAI9589983.1 hypothetical protein GQX74_008151 [Glossina fuscipes]